jgi:hypothetical protein
MTHISYGGNMAEKVPVWAVTTASNYALDLGNTRKIADYLKQKHGNKKVKISHTEILQISPYSIMHTMAITQTCFTIGDEWYEVLQAVTMYISDIVSSVVGHDIILGNSDGFLLEA